MMISSPKKILFLCFVTTILASSCDFVNAESSTDSDDPPGESPGYRYCNICRARRTYTLPDEVISIPTQGDYTCAHLDQKSREGFVPPHRCPNLQAFTSGERCGCVLKSSLVSPSPTPGPTPGPTPAPASASTTPGPTPAPASASTSTGGFGGPFRDGVGGRNADDNDAGVSTGTATSTTYNGMHEGEGTTTDAQHTYNGEHETIDFSFLGDPNVENGVVIDDVSTSTISGGVGGSSHAGVITLVLAALVGLGQ